MFAQAFPKTPITALLQWMAL